MTSRFQICLAETLRWEGGWSDDPYDPGGATNKGITIGRYAAHVGMRLDESTVPMLRAALGTIPDAMVAEIYHRYYWQPICGDDLPAGLDLVLYDSGVNSGPVQGIKWVQRALGVADDGHMGPVTLDAARSCDVPGVIGSVLEQRRDMLRVLPTFWRFGKGWLRRIDGIEALALQMAAPAAPRGWDVASRGTPAPGIAPPAPLPDPAAQSASQGRAITTESKQTSAAPVATVGAAGSGQLGIEMAGAASKSKLPGGGFDLMTFVLHLMQSPTFWVCLTIVAGTSYALFDRVRKARLS